LYALPHGDPWLELQRGLSGRRMEIQVAETPEKKVVLDSSRIVDVGETSERYRFTGGVKVGIIYSKDNQSTQYSIRALAAYPREHWAAQLGLSFNWSARQWRYYSTRNQVTSGRYARRFGSRRV
jgi:hypothetical protein